MKQWSQEAIFQRKLFYPMGDLFAPLLKSWIATLTYTCPELKTFPMALLPLPLGLPPGPWPAPAPTCRGRWGTKCTWLAQVLTCPSVHAGWLAPGWQMHGYLWSFRPCGHLMLLPGVSVFDISETRNPLEMQVKGKKMPWLIEPRNCTRNLNDIISARFHDHLWRMIGIS